MDERYTAPVGSKEDFIATMRAVEEAQPTAGAALAAGLAQAVMREEAGENVQLTPDPFSATSDTEKSMRHDLAGLQGIDLAPFGLAVSVTHETAADGSTTSSSRIALEDGATFAQFLETIRPEDLDNHDLINHEDDRWWLRYQLTIAVWDIVGGVSADIQAAETAGSELSHSTKQFLDYGNEISKALSNSGWPTDKKAQRLIQEIAELPTYVDAGIGDSFIKLRSGGILDTSIEDGPADDIRRLRGRLDARGAYEKWRGYATAARTASEVRPDLAGDWPAQFQTHYQAAQKVLQDSGRLSELMALEEVVVQALAPGHE